MTTKNMHEALNEAKANGDEKLANAITEAWYACDELDPYVEWDDQTNETIVEALNEAGRTEIAERFAENMTRVYGD